MKLKLTCTLDGTPLELELDGVAHTVVGESARARTQDGRWGVVFELEAEPIPQTLPPPASD